MREEKGLKKSRASEFAITINGKPVFVDASTSVAAAMLMAGEPSWFSVRGTERAPFCGMGICMECRATVDGRLHQRTCQVSCTPGMEVVTG